MGLVDCGSGTAGCVGLVKVSCRWSRLSACATHLYNGVMQIHSIWSSFVLCLVSINARVADNFLGPGLMTFNPLLVITGSEIACVRVVGKCGIL